MTESGEVEPGMNLVISVLPHLDKGETVTAVDALGPPEAIEEVTRLAEHESSRGRKFAVEALGKSSSPETQQKLAELSAEDPAEFVRNRARKFTGQQL